MAPHANRLATINHLFKAAKENKLKLVKKLAKKLDDEGEGIQKVLQDIHDLTGKGVLHHAVEAGTSSGEVSCVVKYLVEELDLDVNDKDDAGYTPLHSVAISGDLVTCAYLLDQGASLESADYCQDCTPLHSAAEKGHKELLRLFVSTGADIHAKATAGTPLLYAVSDGHAECVEFLLENGADPNFVFEDRFPPLIEAISADSVDCVMLLLKWGADPNVSFVGENPLYSASVKGNADIVKCLLKAGADPKAPNFWGVTPIEAAAMRDSLSVVTTLFPFTSPIPTITDWSVRGICNYVKSPSFTNQWIRKIDEKYEEAKGKGAEAFKKGQYYRAKDWYSVALSIMPDDVKILSNRSLCYARLQDGQGALADAVACIQLKGDWAKAHYRLGVAWQLLRDHGKAVWEFGKANMLEPNNKELETAHREAFKDMQPVMKHQQKTFGLPYACYGDSKDEAYTEYVSSLVPDPF